MKTKGVYAFLLMLCCISCVEAEEDVSLIKAGQLLEKARVEAEGHRMVYFATQLKGTPYGAGTLEVNDEEQLVARLDTVDCVTFVENVLALTLCDRKDKRRPADYARQLQQIRYRDGKIAGYASRLHYFTEWIENNTAKGIVEERTARTAGAEVRTFDLNFMSEHREAYPALKDDEAELKRLMKVEKKDYHMPYIPKALLNGTAEELDIEDGDILALTTSIEGLDVVHTGIACWRNGRLHLIHASSVKGEVIVDGTSLYDYLKGKKRHTGVRVIRCLLK